VYQVDKSRQTKTMNAYVNGLGPTKRIVMWDTIIAKMDRDELLFIMGHEMGHYVLDHIWKLIAAMLAILFVVYWVAQRTAEAAIARWGEAWGIRSAHDPAAIPVLLAILGTFLFFMTPVMSGISRQWEHEADIFSLELTGLNKAGARAFVKFAEDSKALPDPHPFIRFWRYSHPTLAERIELCLGYEPEPEAPRTR